MFKSIRYKFITIYFLLVFIAIAMVGVFMTKEFEQYHLNVVRETLERSNYVISSIVLRGESLENAQDIQDKILNVPLPGGYEILVINLDTNKVIASTKNGSYLVGQDALNCKDIDREFVLRAALGKTSEAISSDNSHPKYKVKNMAFPYYDKNNKVVGVIYARVDLEPIYKTLSASKIIFIRATIIALIVTIVLGFFIAKSITTPINDVTKKALKMAKGDFNQRVEVKSDDEIGKLGEMFNYLTDKLRNTLLEISNEKNKLDTIIDQMKDGLIAIDGFGNIIHVNNVFIEMLDVKEKNLQGENYNKFIKKYNNNLTLDKFKNAGEISNIKIKDSIIKPNKIFLKDNDMNLNGVILVLQDITEHEKLDNMRKEFIANVSHELKTPLTTIKSYTETLMDGAMDDEEIAMSFLDVINKEIDRMSRLVKDLLQLSQLDYKKTSFTYAKFDLSNLVEDVVKKLEISSKEKNQLLETNLQKCNMLINADKDKIEQVIQNLLSNAIKYTQTGGHIQIISVCRGDNIILTIKDNGIGIAKESLDRIFERFYRVDKARSRDLGGTGLGLSIARHIVEEHDGSIEVKSEVNRGTEFKIILPVDKKMAQE